MSSTFSDLKAERDALQREVFPRLRELCLQHGCRFQAIDLRWGVSEEASLDQQTMKICLDELRRCQRVTPRPNFIVLLGDRYGWRPLPDQIQAPEFEVLRDRLAGTPASELLEAWYRRDDNALYAAGDLLLPGVYALQPRTGRYEDYDWWEAEVERSLGRTLDQAAREVDLPPVARMKYQASAVAQEIAHGALDPAIADALGHVFGFFRTLKRLPLEQAINDPQLREDLKGFVDLEDDGRVDEEAQRSLKALWNDLAARLPGNLHFYEADWQGRGGSADRQPITTTHLEGLCRDVYDTLSRVILEQIEKLEKADPVEQERAAHEDFGQERARHFLGRAVPLAVIAEYLAGESPHPLAVWRESGSGKTALLAQGGWSSRAAHPQAVVVARFIGATPASSDIRLLLESLCREISRAYGVRDDDLPVEFRKLEEEFPRRLALATPDRPLILILDALDQLSDAEQARRLYWLPETLPPHVRLIVSTLPEETSRHDESPFHSEGLGVLKKKLPEKHLVALDPMTPEEGGALLDTWLREAGRTLQSQQREELLSKFAANGLPLYLRLAFEEARHWRSYEAPDQTRLSPNIPGVIRDLFRRLSQPAHHGEVLVSRSLGYLAAGKNGLTEDELLEVLSSEADQAVMEDFKKRSPKSPEVSSLPVAVWSRLHLDLAPYLTERQADGAVLMAYYHRQLAEVVKEDFLSGPVKTARHAALAHYFEQQPLYLVEGQWDSRNVRKVSELPYQQTHGELWDDLEKKTLCNLRFIEAKCAAGKTYDLIADYNLALASFPEGHLEIQKEREHQARVKKYVNEMIAYARAWNEARDKHKQCLERYGLHKLDDISLPKIIPVTEPWSQEKYQEEIAHFLNNPTRLDFIQAFSQFVNAESHVLVDFSSNPGFLAQHAWNSAINGPVAKAAENVLWEEGGRVLILMHAALRSPYRFHAPIIRTVNAPIGRAIAITPDGCLAITSDGKKNLRVWDLERGFRLMTLEGHTDGVSSVDLTPDCRRAISGSYDCTLRVWDLDRSRCLKILEGHTDGVEGVAITPDGSRAISASRDRTLRVWDLDLGECLKVLRGHADAVLSVALTPDGRRAISGGGDPSYPWEKRYRDCNLRVWDPDQGECLKTLKGHTGLVSSVALTPDGCRAISGSKDCTLRLWDLERDRCLRILKGHTSEVESVALTADGRLAISGSFDSTLRVWDLTRGNCLKTLEGLNYLIGTVVARITMDGKRAVSAAGDGTLRVWNLEKGQPIHPMEGHTASVGGVAIIPDGHQTVSVSEDKTMRVWSSESGRCLQKPRKKIWARSIAFTPDGRRAILAAGEDLKIFDLEGDKCFLTMTGDNSIEIASLAITPDGRRAITACWDSTLRVWDLKDGSCLMVLRGGTQRLMCLGITPDGCQAISGSQDTTLRVWNLNTGQCLRTLEGHTQHVNAVDLTPDGRRAVSASYDRSIRVWDLKHNQCLKTLRGLKDRSLRIVVTPDGHKVLSGDLEGSLTVWDLETEERLACYNRRGYITSLSTIRADGQFVLGTAVGEVIFLQPRNFRSLPLCTPVRLWLWDSHDQDGCWDREFTICCPWCGRYLVLAAEVMEAIQAITWVWGLREDQSPCLSLPDEAWEEPRLLSKCPYCRKPLKFNPFIVDNRDRY